MDHIRTCSAVLALCTCWLLAPSAASGQQQADLPAEALRHIEAAREAAGDLHMAVFSQICPRTPGTPDRETLEAAFPSAFPSTDPDRPWYTPPVKVFDNLYFVGQTAFSAWALTTPAGIIVVDAIFDYSVEAEVAEGLRKMGLDPADIEYVIISHGHGDHAAGAKFLQEQFGARIVMGEADWDMVEAGNATWKPRRDIVATDGMEIELGGVTVRLVHTPGHTPGTFSTILPVTDNGQPHTAVVWGGTLFNVRNAPDSPRDYWLGEYSRSAEKLQEIARAAGADVLLSNHTRYDGSTVKIPRLASRQPGQPHPYVIGADAVSRFFTMAAECARAVRVAEAARAGA